MLRDGGLSVSNRDAGVRRSWDQHTFTARLKRTAAPREAAAIAPSLSRRRLRSWAHCGRCQHRRGSRKGARPGPDWLAPRGPEPRSRPRPARDPPAHRVLLLHHLVHLLGNANHLVVHGSGRPPLARPQRTKSRRSGADVRRAGKQTA